MSPREAFNSIQSATKAIQDQESSLAAAQKVVENESAQLKLLRTRLQSYWIDLNRATNYAQLFSMDGQVFMKWVDSNTREEKLVPVTGFVIPPQA